jgi:hypothetical protein
MSVESYVGNIFTEKPEELGEKHVPVPLCPPQIPHGLTRVRTRASAWFRRLVAGLSLRRPEFAHGLVHIGFVVRRVALGEAFFSFEFFCFTLSVSLYRGSILILCHLGGELRPTGGRSSETWSHFIDMNITTFPRS